MISDYTKLRITFEETCDDSKGISEYLDELSSVVLSGSNFYLPETWYYCQLAPHEGWHYPDPTADDGVSHELVLMVPDEVLETVEKWLHQNPVFTQETSGDVKTVRYERVETPGQKLSVSQRYAAAAAKAIIDGENEFPADCFQLCVSIPEVEPDELWEEPFIGTADQVLERIGSHFMSSEMGIDSEARTHHFIVNQMDSAVKDVEFIHDDDDTWAGEEIDPVQ